LQAWLGGEQLFPYFCRRAFLGEGLVQHRDLSQLVRVGRRNGLVVKRGVEEPVDAIGLLAVFEVLSSQPTVLLCALKRLALRAGHAA
jgi:hypothetical protein